MDEALDASYPDPHTIGDILKVYCQMNGGVTQVSRALHVSHSQISLMCSGQLRPNRKVLAALGFRKVELYIPEECADPSLGLPYRS